ncbi:hypothetical protein P152DRAFT_199502 [Eremomyces bilateralis CBS 781.70]|uniref:Uncharacterized protein n=1 Tax=Eremomyces bilateralis CBS 781.70 TaxID=1392243 RepID=A0A6G1GD66_9PEZI|nr:uncharacterized protein P152DRAFT_199502 [Eremomyces bilateralis CBS 781.70]KAF1815850.1 hypothetical protein P152DRAFT_199502 [Eremomyces bilateralis CBS 781.70]
MNTCFGKVVVFISRWRATGVDGGMHKCIGEPHPAFISDRVTSLPLFDATSLRRRARGVVAAERILGVAVERVRSRLPCSVYGDISVNQWERSAFLPGIWVDFAFLLISPSPSVRPPVFHCSLAQGNGNGSQRWISWHRCAPQAGLGRRNQLRPLFFVLFSLSRLETRVGMFAMIGSH